MLRAILNKSWRQHPTRHQLYGHLPPITKTIQARRTRHTGHCWRSKDEFISEYSYGTPHMAKQKQDDHLEHTYSSYVRIRDVALKIWKRRWMIGRSGEKGPGISVLAARHDDDDDESICIAKSKKDYLFLNWHNTEFMCFSQDGAISSLNCKSLKLIDQLIYFDSNISIIESNVTMGIGKMWTGIERLMAIWKSYISDWLKH